MLSLTAVVLVAAREHNHGQCQLELQRLMLLGQSEPLLLRILLGRVAVQVGIAQQINVSGGGKYCGSFGRR